MPRVGPPVPADAAPALDVLDAIRRAAGVSRVQRRYFVAPPALTRAVSRVHLAPVTRLPAAQADRRLRELAPLLARSDNKKTWGLLASHLPGWTGSECHMRWIAMGKSKAERPRLQDDQPPAADAGSRRQDKMCGTILRTMQ